MKTGVTEPIRNTEIKERSLQTMKALGSAAGQGVQNVE